MLYGGGKPPCIFVDVLEVHRIMKEGITEVFKKDNPMEWTQRINGIKARMEELIINGLLPKNRFNFMKLEKC